MVLRDKVYSEAYENGKKAWEVSDDAFYEIEARNSFVRGAKCALDSIWHKSDEYPEDYINNYGFLDVLLHDVKYNKFIVVEKADVRTWNKMLAEYEEVRWAYLTDLARGITDNGEPF